MNRFWGGERSPNAWKTSQGVKDHVSASLRNDPEGLGAWGISSGSITKSQREHPSVFRSDTPGLPHRTWKTSEKAAGIKSEFSRLP